LLDSLLQEKRSRKHTMEQRTMLVFLFATIFMMAVSDDSKLTDALSGKFEKATVNKHELKIAQDVMKGQLMDKWEEKMVHDVTRGIPKENLEEFMEFLGDGLGLEGEQRKQLSGTLKSMKFSREKQSAVLEMGFNIDEMKSVYGYVAMMREEDGTQACAYAFHKLTFKVAQKATKRKFWFIPLGTSYEQVKFDENDITVIKNTFGRHRALELLRQEGVIKAIRYEETMESEETGLQTDNCSDQNRKVDLSNKNQEDKMESEEMGLQIDNCSVPAPNLGGEVVQREDEAGEDKAGGGRGGAEEEID